MKYLITGGAGFIGSHLVEKLITRGDHVIVFDNLSTGAASNLFGIKDQIKFKGEETTSLHVVGTQDGREGSKYEGQIGALICESEDGELMVNVGSGLTDEDRLRTDFIGKIIEVKYNAKIKSKGSNTWSLFLPRYLEIRNDRDTADTIDHIK